MGLLNKAIKLTNKIGITNITLDNTESNSDQVSISPIRIPQNESNKPKVRGKALTRGQQKTLIENGFPKDEIDDYLLHRTSFVQEGSDKRLNQSSNKVAKWTLIHRDTGELREVYVK